VSARAAPEEAGFTLIEVLIATAIFVFVALIGVETLRALGSTVALLAQRATAAAALNTALGQLRSDATSAVAVWVPHAACGPAISMLRRNAAGASFTTYVLRDGSLLRATATGPIDPCSSTLALDTVLTGVGALTASSLAANAIAAHVDPISGNADGGFFASAAPVVAVSSHALDYDGTPILTGNTIVEVGIDVDPALTTIDLIAGNRPNAYTNVLTYACGARCAANAVFPEIASLDVDTCTADAPDLPDTSTYYVASATAVGANGHLITTAYTVRLRYAFTFGGDGGPLSVERTGPAFTWPASANLSDAYPVDYTNNAVRAAGASTLAAFAGPPANLASAVALCASLDDELLYHG
jgi:prepilin-type N-terminal cleavage/methylation domain-containing protein